MRPPFQGFNPFVSHDPGRCAGLACLRAFGPQRMYEWRQRLEAEKGLTRLQIGEQEGLSNARITQMFSLLKLPKEAQEYLAALTVPSHIKSFSVRQLRGLVRLSATDRLEAFRKMRADCERYS